MVEGDLLLVHSQSKAGPHVHHAGHREAGGLIRALRVGLCVEELDLLLSSSHRTELHPHIHDVLRPVSERQQHRGCAGRGFDVEEQGEVSVEGVRQQSQSGLS